MERLIEELKSKNYRGLKLFLDIYHQSLSDDIHLRSGSVNYLMGVIQTMEYLGYISPEIEDAALVELI